MDMHIKSDFFCTIISRLPYGKKRSDEWEVLINALLNGILLTLFVCMQMAKASSRCLYGALYRDNDSGRIAFRGNAPALHSRKKIYPWHWLRDDEVVKKSKLLNPHWNKHVLQISFKMSVQFFYGYIFTNKLLLCFGLVVTKTAQKGFAW